MSNHVIVFCILLISLTIIRAEEYYERDEREPSARLVVATNNISNNVLVAPASQNNDEPKKDEIISQESSTLYALQELEKQLAVIKNSYSTGIVKYKNMKKELATCNELLTAERKSCIKPRPPKPIACLTAGKNLPMAQLKTGKYFFSKETAKYTWRDAQLFCFKNNLQLLSIENAEENKAVIDQVEKLGFPLFDSYFISGTDKVQEGKWYWASTGQKFNFTNWLPNEPNNKNKNQHCLKLWNEGQGIGWDDGFCDSKYKFICEVPSICK